MFLRLILVNSLAYCGSLSLAQGDAQPVDEKLQVGLSKARLAVEFRTEFEQNDHGLLKTGSVKPETTVTPTLNALRFKITGNIKENVVFKSRINLLSASMVDYAKVTHWVTPDLGYSFGKEKVRQGGFEIRESSYQTMVNSPYLQNVKPFDTHLPTIEFNAKIAGLLTLQLLPDVTTSNKGSFSSSMLQPALALEWMGSFGSLSPLVQLGSYDTGHSLYYVLGMKWDSPTYYFIADYVTDLRKRQETSAVDGSKVTLTDNINTVSLEFAYTIPEVVKPFVKLSYFNIKHTRLRTEKIFRSKA